MPSSSTLDQTRGRWPEILSAIGGLSSDQLTDKHQPCPACGGKDRYRWDRDEDLGGWFCNQCGGKDGQGGAGTGIDLLMRVKACDYKTAISLVERHLGIESAPLPKAGPSPSKPPADAKPPSLGNASAQYCYRDAGGDPLFWIQRFDKDNGSKIFVHRTWIDGQWHFPRKADGFSSEWPAPRPLYRLEVLARMPYADVLIVEGEKTADAAVRLLSEFAVVSWPNGCKAIDKIDWTPLKGRFVALWPDNDEVGIKAMDKLARKLSTLGCQVQIIGFPPDAPEGWDVADAVWTPEEALDHVLGNRRPYKEEKAEEKPEPEEKERPFENGPIVLLGFRGNDFFYLPRRSGTVISISSQGHSPANLCRLVALPFWQTLYPTKGGVDWLQATSDLFEEQYRIGEFNPDLLRGRGAWWDRSRCILHLGDHLIIDGVEQPISEPVDSRYHYQRGIRLARLGGIEPLSDAEAFEVINLCDRFYWEMPASSLLLSGWCCLAPICGALPWRPHIWLTAGAGTGKSAVLERFVGNILGDVQLVAQGSSTEAFIRQHLKTDALPVVMDEAESNLKRDADRMQQILALARQASTETRAVQGRGSPSGETRVYRIRSMFLLASIATAVKCGADDRRFTQLTLKRPSNTNEKEESQKWLKLKDDLTTTLTPEFSRRLLARTVGLIPEIRKSLAVFTEVCALHFKSQARGDQYGALLAGAWHLGNSRPATPEDALGMIQGTEWESYVENDNLLPDEEACLQSILQTHLRVQGGDRPACDRTVLELVEFCQIPNPLEPFVQKDAANSLGREGIRVKDGLLFISTTAQGISKILRDSPWSTNWGTILARIEGAGKRQPVHFPGAGTMVAVPLPLPEAGS